MRTAGPTDLPGAHLPGLDLLRALAVVWVMLFHSFLVGGLGPNFEWLSRFGWAGVDIFFVLSGFLIGTQVLRPLAQGQPVSLPGFYLRRALRIVPAYAVVLAVYLAAPALREVPGLAPWWQFTTFTLNLFIDYGTQPAFSHAWSLCVEEHFYLVFPLLAIALARHATLPRVAAAVVALVLAGVALRGATWLHFSALDPPRNWFIEEIYYPTWMRLDGLLAGVALAALRVGRPQAWAALGRHAWALRVAGLALGAVALALFANRTGLLANTLGWPVLSLAIAALVAAGAAPGQVAVPGARALAAMSYSLYLSHKLAFHAVHTTLAPRLAGQPALLFATYAAVTLAVGAALHLAVERPALRWRDRRRAVQSAAKQ